ncbi:sensor kinase/phosphatase LuxQ [Seminavis robusta]|uniref:histidine kinase n=1 Tax=Seminavis robusta TaxID=568900 RepID=A0A9N8HMM0_9STRA|nr:sensor kinase/phosphatase LuxQ [Seminavis robusta]|eukprot:Sro915_g219740.1 sensor kinase/phosphatase LuxQ (1043) ;mRNA; f:27855-31460
MAMSPHRRLKKNDSLSSVGADAPSSRLGGDTAIWRARILFIVSMSCVATVLGVTAYYFINKAEQDLAQTMFESIADRALSEAVNIIQLKRWSAITLASVLSTMEPNASSYPYVTFPGIERLMNNVLTSSSGLGAGFCPIVPSSDISEWEDFIYKYYHETRQPPFPNTTAVSPFGKGIWGRLYLNDTTSGNATTSTKNRQKPIRYRDFGNTTTWGSTRQIVTPVAFTSNNPEKRLLFNPHSDPRRGRAIDDMIECSQRRHATVTPDSLADRDCGVITGMVDYKKDPERGPSAVIYTPVYPANDPTTLVGFVPYRVVFDQLLKNAFADEVSGVDVVLSAGDEVFTYKVVDGQTEPKGDGDLHDTQYDKFRRSIQITAPEYYTENSAHYTMSIYPCDGLYDVYSTHNPLTVTIGAIFIIIFMSVLFFVYDFLVRREFLAKRELLAAKRSFMRFISHEVRTPLNAVCMGITVLQSEFAQSLGCTSVEDMRAKAEGGGENDKNKSKEDLLQYMNPNIKMTRSLSKSMTVGPAKPTGPTKTLSKSMIDVPPETQSPTPSPLFSLETPSTAPTSEASDGDSIVGNMLKQKPFEPAALFPAITSAKLFGTAPRGISRRSSTGGMRRPGVSQQKLSEESVIEWFRLSQEVLRNTLCAVDVLSDALNYDKIESGSLTLELAKLPIWEIVKETMGEFRLSAQRKNIDFQLEFRTEVDDSDPLLAKDVESPSSPVKSVSELSEETKSCKVIGDQVRLVQVLRNLCSNAIKFTPEKGSVHIVATWHRPTSEEAASQPRRIHLGNGDVLTLPRNGYVTVAVQDSGAGLTQGQVRSLFREGVQYNANKLQQGKGSGFGLFISKGIVECHEGCLEAESPGLGHGSTFTMHLPLYLSPDDETSEQSEKKLQCYTEASTEMNKLNILVVDDIASNRKLLCRLLKNAGHNCDSADDGDVALQMVIDKEAEGGYYDTVLLDYEMPKMNGPTAAKEMRQLGSESFIVGITGNMLPEDVSYFMSCGANAVLPKPVKISDLENLWVEYGVVSQAAVEPEDSGQMT